MTVKITGNEAIRIAERDGVTLHKYADPTEGYYCIVEPVGWTGGGAIEGYNVEHYFRGVAYLGPDEDGVEPTWADATQV